MVELIQKLCAKKKITLNKLEKDLGFSKSSISKWKINMPSIDKIMKVADYFNVTTDYLLGKADDPMPLSTNGDIRFALHGVPHDLTEEERQKVIEYAEFLRQQRKDRS